MRCLSRVPENVWSELLTRVEPVVYVYNRHLQLRGDAAILITPFSVFTSFKSELNQNINFDDLYFKHKYLL